MKKSSRIALIMVSVAAGIIIGFVGVICCMNRMMRNVFKYVRFDEELFDMDKVVDPVIVNVENDEDVNV